MNRLHRWYCRSERWRATVRDRLLPWVLHGVELGDDVLEVGPGPGLTTDVLCGLVARVTAIEIDPRLAEALRRRTAGRGVDVVTGDATTMPFEAARFSAVVSFTMLHHVPTPGRQDRVLAEVRRVLRPGGVLAGSDSTTGLLFRAAHLGDTVTPVDPHHFARRLEVAGFIDARVRQASRAFCFRATRPQAPARNPRPFQDR